MVIYNGNAAISGIADGGRYLAGIQGESGIEAHVALYLGTERAYTTRRPK